MRKGRFITTGVAAIVTLAVAPAAWAAPSPLVDNDFNGGTPDANTWVVEPGLLRLKPEVSANFEGTALPAAWESTPWSAGGAATVAGGAVSVNGAHVNTEALPTTSTGVLEFRATFSAAAFQHVGFGDTFENGPWAMFSTGNGGSLPIGLYARTLTAGGAAVDTPVAGIDPLQPHIYRIEWTANAVAFYVDGTLITTTAVTIPDAMRPVISDFDPAAGAVTVDWIARSPYPTSGTFESRVLEADDSRAVWGAVTASPGADVTLATRSGDTPAPDASWSAYEPVGAGGAIQSPPGRYIQYRAALSTTDPNTTPSLDSVSIDYAIDATAPTASIDSATVSGATATVSFSSAAADVARFECSLDNGAFAACTSPKVFAGLAPGTHTIAVRAVDKAGNLGDAAKRDVTVAAPSGGGTPPPSSGGGPTVIADTTAPKVSIAPRTVRASRRGAVKLKVSCPGSEDSCRVSLRLKRGRKTAAKKTFTVLGGETLKVKLQLRKWARLRLAARGRLNVKAVVSARDEAGNRRQRQLSMTLRSPSS